MSSLPYHGKRGTHDALCCCEYIDKDGQASHILACCCDCEALDSICDRFANFIDYSYFCADYVFL